MNLRNFLSQLINTSLIAPIGYPNLVNSVNLIIITTFQTRDIIDLLVSSQTWVTSPVCLRAWPQCFHTAQ